MRLSGILLLCCLAVQLAFATETNLTLMVDGVTYSNVTFGTVTPSSVTIFYRSGVARIPLEKLPAELQKQFGYDPERAKTHLTLEAQQYERYQQSLQAERERADQEQKSQIEKCKDATEAHVFIIKPLRKGGMLAVLCKSFDFLNGGAIVLNGLQGSAGAVITCRVARSGKQVKIAGEDEYGRKGGFTIDVYTFCEYWKPKKAVETRYDSYKRSKFLEGWDTE